MDAGSQVAVIVVCCAALCAGIALLVWYFWRRRNTGKPTDVTEMPNPLYMETMTHSTLNQAVSFKHLMQVC